MKYKFFWAAQGLRVSEILPWHDELCQDCCRWRRLKPPAIASRCLCRGRRQLPRYGEQVSNGQTEEYLGRWLKADGSGAWSSPPSTPAP